MREARSVPPDGYPLQDLALTENIGKCSEEALDGLVESFGVPAQEHEPEYPAVQDDSRSAKGQRCYDVYTDPRGYHAE